MHIGLDVQTLLLTKNNTFQFYEDKKYIKNFAWMNFKYFYICENKKHILATKHSPLLTRN